MFERAVAALFYMFGSRHENPFSKAMQIKQHLQELEDRPQRGHVRSSYGRAATTVVCHKRKISLFVVIVATKRRRGL